MHLTVLYKLKPQRRAKHLSFWRQQSNPHQLTFVKYSRRDASAEMMDINVLRSIHDLALLVNSKFAIVYILSNVGYVNHIH